MRDLILYNNKLADFIDSMTGECFDCNNDSFDAKTDVIENENEYVVRMDVPGYRDNNLKAEIKDSILKVTGNSEINENADKEKYIIKERYSGSFKRQYKLPENIDPDSIAANLDKGILTLTIKKKEEVKAKEIKIN